MPQPTDTLKIPKKRLIVFAGATSHKQRMIPLRNCKVDAVMASYLHLKDSPREDYRVRDFLKSWPVIRYLDSGVFTFLRMTGKLRAKRTDKKGATKGKTQQLTEEEFAQYAQSYIDYLTEHHEDWDWVVELDVDNIFGVEVALSYRKRLREVVGEKLIPVWHTVAGDSGWDDDCKSYPYVGTGSDKPMYPPFYRNIVNKAHQQGCVVHGFGGTRVDVMEQVGYDTCDSTTWLSSVRFGQFGGVNYRQSGKISQLEVRKAQRGGFEDFVRNLDHGYDPEDLTKDGGAQQKFEVAIELFLQRQNALPPIPRPAIINTLL